MESQPAETKKIVHESSTAETVVVVLCLMYFWPLGLLLLWLLVKNWTTKAKWFITAGVLVPVILAFIAIIMIIGLSAANPASKLERAQQDYMNSLSVTPTIMFNQ